MGSTIGEFAENFIDNSALPAISDYKLNYNEEIDGLYIDSEMKLYFKNCCHAIRSARKDLSSFTSADFSNGDFFSFAIEYLENIKNVSLIYFKNYSHKS
ncbi:MAG: hypothetical protein K2I17_03515, partial [Clostridia bacterium]|nr:hypothetical protein [Clostridia bacterium]